MVFIVKRTGPPGLVSKLFDGKVSGTVVTTTATGGKAKLTIVEAQLTIHKLPAAAKKAPACPMADAMFGKSKPAKKKAAAKKKPAAKRGKK